MEEEQAHSVAVMKYQARDGSYRFIVKDKYDFPDELDRLDYLNDLRNEMLKNGKMLRFLWTKETVLF